MSNYERGRKLEWQVVSHLESEGYEIIRAAGSKGKIDVLAFKPGQVLVIQCKITGSIGPSERGEVIRLAMMFYGGIPIVAWHRPGTAKPQYHRLVGLGPKDRVPFLTDEVGAT